MLYSVREASADDLEGTLREVAAIGYEGVELFDLHGHDAGDGRRLARRARARRALAPQPARPIETSSPRSPPRRARSAGSGSSSARSTRPSSTRETLARIAIAATAAAAHGLELGYHNHDAEVAQGFLDRLPADVFLELDAGWAWYAGARPGRAARARAARAHQGHPRRAASTRSARSATAASATSASCPAAVEAGVEWLIVEQDESDGSELDDARRSLAALIRMLGVVA